MTKPYNLEITLQSLYQLKFRGNMTPHIWYKKITFENGKPDLHAILILSDILYWYRPHEVRDESTGEILGFKKKFKADMLQRSTSSLATQFGLSQRQTSDALKRLSDQGLIIKEQRQIKTSMGILPNVLFVAPIVEKIAELQSDINMIEPNDDPASGNLQDDYFVPLTKSIRNTQHSNVGYAATQRTPSYVEMQHGVQSSAIPPASERMTYTEITTKNSTENSTKTTAANAVVNPANIIETKPSLAAADFNYSKNKNANAITVTLTTPNTHTEQNQFQDAMIGTELTQNQQHKIKRYVDENYEKLLQHLAAKDILLQGIIDEILNPKSFTKTEGFNHKFNAIKCAIKKNQWQPGPLLKIQQATQIEQEQKIKSLKSKIREFEIELDGAVLDLKNWDKDSAMAECRLRSIAVCDEALKPLLAELAAIEQQQNSQDNKHDSMIVRAR